MTYFKKETIEQLALAFMANGGNTKANVMHTANLAKNTFIYESFIKDSQRGINAMQGYESLPDGTWFISMKVNDDEVWEKVKSSEYSGFSIEGIFGNRYEYSNEIKEVINLIDSLIKE
jgi:hypothetical protein